MTQLNPITRLTQWLWSVPIQDLPAPSAWLVRVLRIIHAVLRDSALGQINLRAMSLVYTTLLSIVPLLAFSFSVLKGFGVHNQLEPILSRTLMPLGERAPEIADNIVEFVDNIQVGVLGSVGLLLLVYIVYSLLQKIETALNETWHVHRKRGLTEKFSNYLSVVLIGPVLAFSAVGLTASLSSNNVVQRVSEIEPFGSFIVVLSTLTPYVLVIAAFTFIYMFVPNTKVRIRAALIGAVIAGLAWQTTGWIFATVVTTSAKYTAIYSGFASLLFFIIWLYLSWLILLAGGKIAFYIQNPQFVTRLAARTGATHQEIEELGLSVMYLVAGDYLGGRPGWTFERLCRALHVRGDVLENVIARLNQAHLLVQTDDARATLLPARDLGRITLNEIYGAARGQFAADDPEARMHSLSPVVEIMNRVEEAAEGMLSSMTLRELAERGDGDLPDGEEG